MATVERKKVRKAKEKTKTDESKKRKPTPPPSSPKEWLERYIQNPDSSTAKKITHMLNQGASMEQMLKVGADFADKLGTKFGRQKGHITAHISFLKSKGLQISEKDGRFKIV